MNVITFTIKDLLTKKVRFAVSVLGISLGICACIIMLGVADTIRNSFNDLYKRRATDLVLVEGDQLSLLASELDQEMEAQLQSYRAIESTAAVLISSTKMQRTYIPVFGWAEGSFLFENIKVTQRALSPLDKPMVLMGDLIAKNLNKKPGETIKIRKKEYTISGVYTSPNSFERGAVVMPLSALQGLTRKSGKVTLINVRLKPEYRHDEAMDVFIERVENEFPQVSAQKADFFIAEKTKHMVMGEKLSWIITIIMTVAMTLGVSNIMLTNFMEKTRFLSLLLTVGWQKSEVAFFFLLESLVIVFLGGAIGTMLGMKLMIRVFQLTDISVLAPALSLGFFLKIIGLICGIALLAVIGPTVVLMNYNPLDVIKNE